jgi:hypothetical protein
MKSIILQTNDTAITADDQLGQIQFAASSESDGSAAQDVSAKIEAVAEAAFGSASHSTALIFSTATTDANAPAERVRISNDGKVGVGSNSPSFKLHVNGDIGLTNEGFYASPTGVKIGTDGVLINDGQTTLSHGNFSADGDAQSSSYILRCTTTNATFTTAQNNGADIVVPNDTSIMFIASITGRRTDQVNASTNDNASYTLIGLLHNDGGGIALLGSVSKTVIAETDSDWDVQATVTGTGSSGSDKLNIQCKGAASKTVNWVVKLETVEVKGGEHVAGSALFTSSQSSSGAGTVGDPFIVASDQIANASVFTLSDVTDKVYVVIQADCGVNDQSGQDDNAFIDFKKGGTKVHTETASESAHTHIYSLVGALNDVYGFGTTDGVASQDIISCRAVVVQSVQSFTITKVNDGQSAGNPYLRIRLPGTLPYGLGAGGIMVKLSGNVVRGGSNRAFTGAQVTVTRSSDRSAAGNFTTTMRSSSNAGNGSQNGTETVAGNSVQIQARGVSGSSTDIDIRGGSGYAMNNLNVIIEALTDELESGCGVSNTLTGASIHAWGDDD